ncbi:MAG: hypothetical protein KGJ07_00665 [Patescibacteria group bacterium]|nr:hypothetical protein [Patescibacteria group bacterium]MDE2589497.1 hypothetical protein [Patescibacteria group bacterium]
MNILTALQSLLQALPTPLIIAFFVLIAATLLYFLYAYYKETKIIDSEEETLSAYQRIMRQAHQQARDIIKQASSQAKGMLTDTQFVKSHATKELDRDLAKESAAVVQAFQDALEQVTEEAVATMKNTTDSIGQVGSTQVSQFREALAKEITVHKDALDKLVADEFAKAREEVAGYKKEQMEKVDKAVSKVVVTIVEQVLGKMINTQDHEDLVVQALEQAKKDGLFHI